jgi:hypothetical protein
LGPQPLTHAPLWQVAVPAVQAWHPWPPMPQARSVWWVRVTQLLPSQQPWAQLAAVHPPPSVVSQTRLLLQKSPPGHWATQAVPLQQPLQFWAVQVVGPASDAVQAPAWQDWSAEQAEQSAPLAPQSTSPVPTRQLPPAVQQPEQFEGPQVLEEHPAASRARAPRAARAIRGERVME